VRFRLFDRHRGPLRLGHEGVFEVEWPGDERQRSRIRSHFGARRFAKNWAIALVKADLEAKKTNPDHASVPWTLHALRTCWNQEKHEVAPWWAENSKECYAAGIADAAAALDHWSKSKRGLRQGRRVGFSGFESRRSGKHRVRFTTGALRLEDDRRQVTLRVIGRLRAKENTRRVQRHVAKGNARILSMTLSERWGFSSRSRLPSAPGSCPQPARGPGRMPKPASMRGCGSSPPSSTATIRSSSSRTRLRSAKPWPSDGECHVPSPDRYLAPGATGRRKPSSPGWTAGRCASVERPTTSSRGGWWTPTARSTSRTSTSRP
jgi:hypothetical protein